MSIFVILEPIIKIFNLSVQGRSIKIAFSSRVRICSKPKVLVVKISILCGKHYVLLLFFLY